jgi:hypothetical protein
VEKVERILTEKINRSIVNLKLHSVSSNQLYFFECDNDEFVLKIPNMQLSGLSPFWKQLRYIFGSDFITQAKNINYLVNFLCGNPYDNVPKCIFSESGESVLQIFERVSGDSYEPDEFPQDKVLNYQLGQYIGWLHSHEFSGYGVYSDSLELKNGSGLIRDVIDSMGKITDEYWNANQQVKEFYNSIDKLIPTQNELFSLIMPDISGNQFVYSDNLKRISAVVVLDAYVVGPINLELTVLEMCLTDHISFQEGYQQYCSLPRFDDFRRFYRFFLYLNDPWNPMELNEFMERNIFFQ